MFLVGRLDYSPAWLTVRFQVGNSSSLPPQLNIPPVHGLVTTPMQAPN